MDNKIGAIPEFTTDESVVAPTEETVVPVEPEEPEPTEPETPADPLPANTPELEKKVVGLENEREKLLEEIKTLRGTRRELKQEQINVVENKITELTDVNPEDVAVIDKVLRAKGYITKDEAKGMTYEATKQDELNKFLEKYPEYKPENDANDINWSALNRELGYYRMPDDPRKITEVLERAHRNVSKGSTQPSVQVRKQQVAVASHGSGGVQRSTPRQDTGRLSPQMKAHLIAGGWTEEDIKNY